MRSTIRGTSVTVLLQLSHPVLDLSLLGGMYSRSYGGVFSLFLEARLTFLILPHPVSCFAHSIGHSPYRLLYYHQH